MRYASIRKMDISNGTKIGVALFVQGCPFHCEDCFNSDTWNFNGGKEWTKETEESLFELCHNPYISRLSILGGECLAQQNIDTVVHIAKEFKSKYPDKDLWIWTGYKIENIVNKEILNYADYIIDGQFEKDKKNLNLQFRGSSNQRIWRKTEDGWVIVSGEK